MANGEIYNPAVGKCLDTTPPVYPTPPPGASAMSLRTCSGAASQLFDVAGTPTPAFGRITQVGGGQCLQQGVAVDTSAINLAFQPCQASTTSQNWMVEPNGTLLNAAGACLDNNGNGTTSGNRVTTYPCASGALNEQWTETVDGRIINPATGECLDSTAPTNAGGSPLAAGYPGMSLTTCTGTVGQLWNLPTPQTVPALYGLITPQANANQCMDPIASSGGAIPDGTALQLYTCPSASNVSSTDPYWRVLPDGTIRNDHGTCLDNNGWGTADGNMVSLWQCTADANQQWTLKSNGAIVNPQSGKCLDSTAPTTQGGRPVPAGTSGMSVETCTGAPTQLWNTPVANGPISPSSVPTTCVDGWGPASYAEPCAPNTLSQNWTFQDNGTIQTTAPGQVCLNVSTPSPGMNIAVNNSACHPDWASQQWVPGPGGTIVNPATAMCLTVNADNPTTVAACTAAANQTLNLPKFEGRIQQQGAGGLCLDQSIGMRGPEPAQIQTGITQALACAPGSATQDWTLSANGTLTNVTTQSTGCLTIWQNATADGADLVMQPCIPGAADQQWSTTTFGAIVNAPTGKCLTFGRPGNTNFAVLSTCTGAANQLIKLTTM